MFNIGQRVCRGCIDTAWIVLTLGTRCEAGLSAMKCRIERRRLPQLRSQFPKSPDESEALRLVQRSKSDEPFNRGQRRISERGWPSEPVAAVHDMMADSEQALERVPVQPAQRFIEDFVKIVGRKCVQRYLRS
jgi:hypothetical protein